MVDTKRCYKITDPLTGQSQTACFSPPLEEAPKVSVVEPKQAAPTFPPTDYRYGPYCSGVSYLRDKNPVLTRIARTYDPIFEAGEKMDRETLSALGDYIGLENSPHAKWWLTRGGLAFYALAVGTQLKKLNALSKELEALRQKVAKEGGRAATHPDAMASVAKELEQRRAKLLERIQKLKDSSPEAVITRGIRQAEKGEEVLRRARGELEEVKGSLTKETAAAKISALSESTQKQLADALSPAKTRIAKLEEALKHEEALLKLNESSALRRAARYANTFGLGAYEQTPFKVWFAAWLSLSQILRGPDEILDSTKTGRELTGRSRALAYTAVYGATLSAAVYMVNQEYSTLLASGGRISSRAQWIWSLWWLLYTGYQYGKVDQREALRINGQDPKLADNPLHWSLDNHDWNRLNSNYTSWAADAVFWALAPKISKGIVNATFRQFGHPGYDALPFTAAEKKALLTLEERAYLESAPKSLEAIKRLDLGTPLKRSWTNMKFSGRAIRLATWGSPSRLIYTGAWFATNLGLVSIPLARVQQFARSITEGNTLGGVGMRPMFSGALNQLLVNPLRYAGINPSVYGFYFPGMAAVVYPWDGCNEIPTAAHQLALSHLERYRWQTDDAGRNVQKEAVQKYFALSDPKDKEKDIKKYREILPDSSFYDLFPEFPKASTGALDSGSILLEGALAMDEGIPLTPDLPELTEEDLALGETIAQEMVANWDKENIEDLVQTQDEDPDFDPFVGHFTQP